MRLLENTSESLLGQISHEIPFPLWSCDSSAVCSWTDPTLLGGDLMDTDRWDMEASVILSRLRPQTRVLIEALVDRRGKDLLEVVKDWTLAKSVNIDKKNEMNSAGSV